MENQPRQNEQSTDDAERHIRAKDRFYNITDKDPHEEMTALYPVVRNEKRDPQGNVISPQRVEAGWMLIGEGADPNTGEAYGKFAHKEPDGRPAYKWLAMDAQNELRRQELERAKIFKPGLGRAAVRAVESSSSKPFIEPENERTKSSEEMAALLAEVREAQDPVIPNLENMMSGTQGESQSNVDQERSEREELRRSLDKITKGLSETDKTALWFYANSINEAEEQNQIKKMSSQARSITSEYKRTVQTFRSGGFARYRRQGGEN